MLLSCKSQKPAAPTTANNLFTSILGKSQAEVDARIDSVWTHFFTPGDLSRYEADGEKSVYYEVGDSMATDEQCVMMRHLLRFFKNDGFRHGQFNLDGSEPTDGYTEGMAGANAVGAFALADSNNDEDVALAREYVQRLWDVQPPTGKWRYYVGMVYFLSMLHVSGHFAAQIAHTPGVQQENAR